MITVLHRVIYFVYPYRAVARASWLIILYRYSLSILRAPNQNRKYKNEDSLIYVPHLHYYRYPRRPRRPVLRSPHPNLHSRVLLLLFQS